MKKVILIVLIISLLLTLVSCKENINPAIYDGSSIKETEAAVSTEANGFYGILDDEIPSLLKSYNVPGVAVAVIDNSRLVLAKGYGYADRGKKLYMSGDTIFQAASISKPVTAWGIMKLVEQGRINLDAPVEKYIKRWNFPGSDYDSKGVTIRRLLNHTAGLSVTGYPGVEPSATIPTIEESLKGYGPYVKPLSIIHEPGTKW